MVADRSSHRQTRKVFFQDSASGTRVRDFLPDTDEALATENREQFLETQRQIEDQIVRYQALAWNGDTQSFRQFSRELRSSMRTLAPVLGWTVGERHAQGLAAIVPEGPTDARRARVTRIDS